MECSATCAACHLSSSQLQHSCIVSNTSHAGVLQHSMVQSRHSSFILRLVTSIVSSAPCCCTLSVFEVLCQQFMLFVWKILILGNWCAIIFTTPQLPSHHSHVHGMPPNVLPQCSAFFDVSLLCSFCELTSCCLFHFRNLTLDTN